jgi:hypothetical protein
VGVGREDHVVGDDHRAWDELRMKEVQAVDVDVLPAVEQDEIETVVQGRDQFAGVAGLEVDDVGEAGLL